MPVFVFYSWLQVFNEWVIMKIGKNGEYLFQNTETGPLYVLISQSSFNSFKIIYHDSTTIETSTIPAICIFKKSNLTFWLIFQNSGICISFVTSLSPNWVKRDQSCISSIEDLRVIGRLKSTIDETLKWGVCFWDLFLKKIAIFIPMMMSLNKVGWKRAQLVFHVPMVIERWNSIVKGDLRWIITFWNYCYYSPWWCHQPKNVSKRSKLVFHVPMLTERWKSKVEGALRCIIPLWKCFLKILKFWFSLVTSSTQNWLEKGLKSVSHVLMVIERWKSKVKGVLLFFRLWNYFLEILEF